MQWFADAVWIAGSKSVQAPYSNALIETDARAPRGGDTQHPAGHNNQCPCVTRPQKELFTLLDLCVSSLRRGHANLLCIVPILTDDPRRESKEMARRNGRLRVQNNQRIIGHAFAADGPKWNPRTRSTQTTSEAEFSGNLCYSRINCATPRMSTHASIRLRVGPCVSVVQTNAGCGHR